MLGEGGTPLSKLQAAVREFQAREDRQVDNKELRGVIDALEGEFCANAWSSQQRGEHLVGGNITRCLLDRKDLRHVSQFSRRQALCR